MTETISPESQNYTLNQYHLGRHKGGTKFYEIALFCNARTSQRILVRRYAKNSLLRQGGASQVTCSGGSLAIEHRKLLKAKASGGYVFSVLSSDVELPIKALYSSNDIAKFYRGTSQAAEIRKALSLTAADTVVTTSDRKKPAVIVKPIERPAMWGSW